jgi:YebC/PmpR family DNA-binding regulatory protein
LLWVGAQISEKMLKKASYLVSVLKFKSRFMTIRVFVFQTVLLILQSKSILIKYTMGRAFEYRRAAKEKRWDKMSKVFPKLGKLITIAAREGGPDPEMNARLRNAIQNAKAENMPKENIENAIKRASGKDAETMVEVFYEGKGPHGVLVYVECATDNTTRTVANVKSYFNKVGGSFVPSGSLEFMFSRKAVFECKMKEGLDIEEIELELIDAGLEEIEVHDEMLYAYADYTHFGQLHEALESQGIEIEKSGLQRFPNSPVVFTEDQKADIEKLIDKIEEDDDVQAVYTNMA